MAGLGRRVPRPSPLPSRCGPPPSPFLCRRERRRRRPAAALPSRSRHPLLPRLFPSPLPQPRSLAESLLVPSSTPPAKFAIYPFSAAASASRLLPVTHFHSQLLLSVQIVAAARGRGHRALLLLLQVASRGPEHLGEPPHCWPRRALWSRAFRRRRHHPQKSCCLSTY